MKKQVKVIGIQHKNGTSKANKPYDFYLMHYTHPDPDTEGVCAGSLVIPDHEVPALVIGADATLFSHFYNNKEYFDAILY